MPRSEHNIIRHFDWLMFFLLLLVSLMGLANLHSSSHLGGGPFEPSPKLIKQALYYCAGLGWIAILLAFDYRVLSRFSYVIYTLIVGMLTYVLFFGKTIAGTRRWIDLGVFNLQPSELAKLAIIIVLADYYSGKTGTEGYTLRELLAPIALTAVPFVLIQQEPDLGTALMLGILFASITLFVRVRRATLVQLALAAAGLGTLAWKYVLKPYQRRRIETFLNPDQDPAHHGYQIMQSKIAMGSGGLFGNGYFEGTQGHLHFLPERHTDFAFAIWAEEWGFAGSVIFLGFYFLMLVWGLNTALTARDRFGIILAFGCVMLLFWQAVINLGMIMGVLPVVGMPLPLFSYGGSSLLTSMLAVGILMNVRMRRFQE